MEQHREARRIVAQAMQGAGGAMALQAQFERLEALQVMVQGDPESFQDPQGFALQLGKLAEGARYAYQNGNRIQACQMGVLAEQAVRTRQRDQANVLASHPELKVALGAAAIAWHDARVALTHLTSRAIAALHRARHTAAIDHTGERPALQLGAKKSAQRSVALGGAAHVTP